MSDSESLNAAKDRIVAALRTRSWSRFRKECCPTIAIEEYWRLYSSYLDPQYRETLPKGSLFPEGQDDETSSRAYVVGSRVDTLKPPSKKTLAAFHSFCEYVLHTRQNRPDPPRLRLNRKRRVASTTRSAGRR